MRFGLMVNLGDAAVIEIAGWLGYDFVWIDGEQGPLHNLTDMLRAAESSGIEPWVRVPDSKAATIGTVLNAGARGVIIPHINTRTDAEKAVRHAKHHPLGRRNWFSKARDCRYGLDSANQFASRRNRTARLILQLEEPEAIDNVTEILGVDGIDMVVTGPGDLAHCLGIPGRLDDARILAAEEAVFAAAARRGLPMLHFADTAEQLSALAAGHEIEHVVIASDVSILLGGLRAQLSEISGTGTEV